MALVKNCGSLHRPPNIKPEEDCNCFAVPPSTVDEIISKQVDVNHPNDILDHENYVTDTVAAGKTTTTNSELSKAISAYSAYGSNITVTFYHSLNAQTYQRTWQTDFSLELDNVHYSYLKINNFQMKLESSMNFAYEPGETRSQLSGEAILYPYFCPNQGDLFVYSVDENHMGLFRIYEAPERLTISESTCHKIKFILMSYLTIEQLNKLNACVEQEMFFNLDRYLNDSGALMTSGENDLLNKAKSALNMLINAYCGEFYEDQIFNTFIESDCLYDPYLIEFITKILPLDKMPGYPTQLVSNPVNWRRSFWFKLLAPDMVPDEILITRCFRVVKEVNYRTAGINALANRCYIAIVKPGKHPYPPFRIPAEYKEDIQTLPMQVRLYFDQGRVRPEILLDLANKILTCSRHAQFYYIPILIFLFQKLINALETGSDIIYNEDPDEEDKTGDCMDGCLNCIYNCNPGRIPEKGCPGKTKCVCHKDDYIPDDGGTIHDSPCASCHGDCGESYIGKFCPN